MPEFGFLLFSWNNFDGQPKVVDFQARHKSILCYVRKLSTYHHEHVTGLCDDTIKVSLSTKVPTRLFLDKRRQQRHP